MRVERREYSTISEWFAARRNFSKAHDGRVVNNGGIGYDKINRCIYFWACFVYRPKTGNGVVPQPVFLYPILY